MIFTNRNLNYVNAPSFLNPQTKKPIKPEQCIFLDVETVSGEKSFDDLPSDLQLRWVNKVEKWIKYSDSSKAKILDAVFQEFESQENNFDSKLLFDIYKKYQNSNPTEQYSQIAGLYPEFDKIVCISVGYYKDNEFQKITFVGDEYSLLSNFQFGINKIYERLNNTYGDVWVVGHNVSFFDVPYITKRMAINGLLTPSFLHQPFLQPWNKKIIDTATEWRVGNTTGDATLETIMIVLNMENPKNSVVNGEKMSEYYYSDVCDINVIADYCENDVQSVKNLFVYLQNLKVCNI